MKTNIKITNFVLGGIIAMGFISCGSNPTETPAVDEHAGHNHESKSPEDMQPAEGRVFFVNLNDGDTVSNPVALEFGVEGMTVKPAGELTPGTGHHHLLIGNDSIPTGDVVPANDKNIHYGKGQTADTLELPKGKTKIALQFADGAHSSYGSKLSTSIEVFVK
jgi:hypothetical protein